MAQLAEVATVNGVPAGFSYGSDPNNAATWDATRIYGCLCDPGYEGYDCSLRSCPYGDDPGTYLDHPEVMLLNCTATGGFLTLTFRGDTTSLLAGNATTIEGLQAALQGLPSLLNSNLTIYFSLETPIPPNATFFAIPPALPNNTQIETPYSNITLPIIVNGSINSTAMCQPDGSQVVIIEFIGVPGPLPPLLVDTSLLQDSFNFNGNDGTGAVVVATGGQSIGPYQSLTGTTENDECNHRGICDHNSGVCKCFRDWGSSDGSGGIGGLGDCGYRRDDINPFWRIFS